MSWLLYLSLTANVVMGLIIWILVLRQQELTVLYYREQDRLDRLRDAIRRFPGVSEALIIACDEDDDFHA